MSGLKIWLRFVFSCLSRNENSVRLIFLILTMRRVPIGLFRVVYFPFDGSSIKKCDANRTSYEISMFFVVDLFDRKSNFNDRFYDNICYIVCILLMA